MSQDSHSVPNGSGAFVAPGWLADVQQNARDAFHKSGLPDRRVERWKYTPLTRLGDVQLSQGQIGSATGEAESLLDQVMKVVWVQGRGFALPEQVPAGVQMHTLADYLESQDGAVRDMLENLAVSDRGDAMHALNTAHLDGGLVIKVAAATDAGKLLLQWQAHEPKVMSHLRLFVILEAGAQLTLVEQFENPPDADGSLNVVQQIALGDTAKLTHIRLQQQGSQSNLLCSTGVGQSDNSHYEFTALDIGYGLARHDVAGRLQGSGAYCSLSAATLGCDESHSDHHFEADHQAPGCTSTQVFRSMAGGRSKVVYNGRVHIAAGADQSDASQSSAGLLLSRLAEIDAKPELEIYADEVVAAHGATVGQLDEQALFYMRSRGISQGDAQKILTLAFCRSVIDALDDAECREALAARLDKAMDKLRLADV